MNQFAGLHYWESARLECSTGIQQSIEDVVLSRQATLFSAPNKLNN